MLKDMIVEMNSLVNNLSDLKEDKEVCKSTLKHTILVNEVNNVIKTKLLENKDIKAIGLNDKQFKAIINLYMTITEEVMTLKQINYLKTITKKQASEVITILNNYKRNININSGDITILKQRKENLLSRVESYKKDLRNILSKEVKNLKTEEKLIEVYTKYFNEIAKEVNDYNKTDKEYAKDLIEYAENKFELIKSVEDYDLEKYIVISLGLVTGDTVAKDGIFTLNY